MRLCLVLSVVLVLNGSYGYNTTRSSTRHPPKQTVSIEYFTRQNRHITIPVMVHFDKALTSRLAKEHKIKTRSKLKSISKSILKEVEAFYRHPSLNYTIQFKLLDTRFVRQSRVEMTDNGSEYLTSYCTRQSVKKKENKSWWFSLMLTGRDLYYLDKNGKEVRSSTGRGYMRGICAVHKSCAVIEWNPKNIGYLIAHEIGHSLGMTHDGPPHNECKPHINIMGGKYHPLHPPKTWSQCNKRHLEQFLKTRKAWCLKTFSNGPYNN